MSACIGSIELCYTCSKGMTTKNMAPCKKIAVVQLKNIWLIYEQGHRKHSKSGGICIQEHSQTHMAAIRGYIINTIFKGGACTLSSISTTVRPKYQLKTVIGAMCNGI